MKKRTLEKLIDILIVGSCVTGLLFLFGVLGSDAISFTSMNQLMTILTILSCIYYLIEFIWIQAKKKGIFFSLVKYILLVSVSFCTIFGWIFMRPFYELEADNVQTAYLFLHILIPLLEIAEYMVSEKGHFNQKFLITFLFLTIVYLTCVLLLGEFANVAYPYAFLNPKQLTYKIVLEECVILIVVLFFYGKAILWIDRKYRKKKRKRNDL